MARVRRKSYSLNPEERAIIRTWDLEQDAPTDSRHYTTTLDVSSTGLMLYSATLLPVGEVLHIDVSMQGRDAPYTVKGVAREAHRSDDAQGYVITVDLVSDKNAASWRRQFH